MPEVIDLDTILKSDRFKLFRKQNKDWVREQLVKLIEQQIKLKSQLLLFWISCSKSNPISIRIRSIWCWSRSIRNLKIAADAPWSAAGISGLNNLRKTHSLIAHNPSLSADWSQWTSHSTTSKIYWNCWAAVATNRPRRRWWALTNSWRMLGKWPKKWPLSNSQLWVTAGDWSRKLSLIMPKVKKKESDDL